MALVLRNGLLASAGSGSVASGSIAVEDGRIAWVGEDAPGPGDTVLDLSGRLVMPGNVCAHTHVYSALARGMPAPSRTPRNFPEILEYVWWRLDRALDAASIRMSGLVAGLDAIRAGTTTLVDHHASPSAIDGSLDLLADAFGDVGVRGVLCYEVTDRGGPERSRAGLAENERFLRDNARPLARGMVGGHASFTLEDGTLEDLAALADRFHTGVHIHVAEDAWDEEDSLRRSGKRAAVRLADAGVLGPASIAAHGVHLDVDEVNRIREEKTWLVHNCRSNLNNSVGRAAVGQWGGRAALGTDGIDGDMFAEARTAFFRAREDSLDASADTWTRILARGGELVSGAFGGQVGTLQPGAAADLIILDYDPPTPLTGGNLPWHWVFAFHSGLVRSVMVGGRWVLRDGEFCDIDEERVRAEARREARLLWERMESLE